MKRLNHFDVQRGLAGSRAMQMTMKTRPLRRAGICLLSLVGAATAVGCKSPSSGSTDVVAQAPAALFSSDPGTVVPGPALVRVASCPGNKLPDLCGSWDGVELKASTGLRPAQAIVDQHCHCRQIAFQVPASLPVTKGNAGNGDTVLTFRKAGAQLQKCTYHGNARFGTSGKQTGGDAYELVNCNDQSTAGSTVKADWFSLEVRGGDQSQGPTEVSVRLGAPDVVNGVVQEEIVYASDPRIPGAALHIPRGSTPPGQGFSFAVLPQPVVGSSIANGGDSVVTMGYAVDFHATGVDQFVFTDVPGAACPRIDLPYSESALLALGGPGAESRLRARQITDLAGLTSGASVLASTAPVTIDPVNKLVSFCVSHLSFYATIGRSLDATLCGAYLTTPPTRPCTTAANCNAGEVCNGNCYTQLLAPPTGNVVCPMPSLPASPLPPVPALLPNTQYVLHLDFNNNGSTGWTTPQVSLMTTTTGPGPTLYPSVAGAPTPWSANVPQTIASNVAVSSNVSFDVTITSPASVLASMSSPLGGKLNLCLLNGTAPFGECFSWDPGRSMMNTGSTNAALVEVCDNDDNDGNGETDDINGNIATEPGKPCDNGQSGSCLRPGVYECDGLYATKCNAPTPPKNSCGGCAALAQEPNTSCDTGQVFDVCAVPGLAECDGLDAVRCVAEPIPPNACGGCLQLDADPNTSCNTGLKGVCAAGVRACNGLDALTCAQTVAPSAEICDSLDNDCSGRFDEGCPMDVGYSQLLFDLTWSPWFGPGDPERGFSGSFLGASCPNFADGQSFPSGLSTRSGALVDKIAGVHCSKIALNSNESVIPYQYSISWTGDVFTIPGHVGGPGGGAVITNCEPPGLMSGIQGTYNGSALVSLEVQCARLSLTAAPADNATMTELERYWAGPVGGSGGTPFAFECGPGQYIAYFYAIGTDEILDGEDEGFVKNVRIGCGAIGVRYR